MPKNQTKELSRGDAILAAALPLFLANGYEKTSIRMIATAVGCEVGLVYYYFETKEEIFEKALGLYFASREAELAALAEEHAGEAFLDTLIAYLEREAPAFAETFHESVHWSIRFAVRTKFAELALPHIKAGIAPLPMTHDSALTAKAIADLLIPAAFDGDKMYFARHKDALRAMITALLGTEKSAGKRKDIPSFLL